MYNEFFEYIKKQQCRMTLDNTINYKSYTIINEKLNAYDSMKYQISLSSLQPNETHFILPRYITFTLNERLNEKQFRDIFKNVLVSLTIGSTEVFMHKLSLYMDLEKPLFIDSIKNQFIVKLPYEYFCNHIDTQYINMPVMFSILLNNSNESKSIKNIKLCCKLIQSDNYTRPSKDEKNIRQIQNITSQYITIDDKHKTYCETTCKTTTKINAILSDHFNVGICRGYFIRGDTETCKLMNIQLLINNELYLNYDRAMIHMECKKINDEMLYMPLNVGNFEYSNYKQINKNLGKNCFSNTSMYKVNMILTYVGTTSIDICPIHCLIVYYYATMNNMFALMNEYKNIDPRNLPPSYTGFITQ